MQFEILDTKVKLEEIKGSENFSLIFKHNTTCPISKSVKRRLEEDGGKLPKEILVYMLDLLTYRDISDAIAEDFNVTHELPQVLLIKDGKCIYNQSLHAITVEEILQEF